jgi:NADH-quinone oxidoreductase subunit C
MPDARPDRRDLTADVEALAGRFAGPAFDASADEGELSVRLAAEALPAVLRCLRDERGFNAFEDLAVFDNLAAVAAGGGGARFTVVYRLYRFPGGDRARLAVDVAEGRSVPSAVPVYRAADWAEREAFDMFGVRFDGHPDLRRVYLPDDFEGHPLRKDFPLAGRTGGV